MSSHHFVKEGQEPALFILDPISFQLAGPLLEWAPLVLVLDNALEDVLGWGIKIDVVLAEESCAEEVKQILAEQGPVTILTYAPGQPPIINALSFLTGTKQVGVNIMTAVSDHGFAQAEKCMGRLQVNLVDEKLKWSAIAAGSFQKWLPAHANLRIRKSVGSQIIHFEGLAEKEDGFESTTNGIISIRSEQLFWVGEPHS